MNFFLVICCTAFLLTASNIYNAYGASGGKSISSGTENGTENGTGSGTGSGSGMQLTPPELVDCPVQPINLTIVRANLFQVNITSVNLPMITNGHDAELNVMAFSASVQLSLMMVDYCSPRSECITIQINASSLSTATNDASFNLSIVATNAKSREESDPCVITVNLLFMAPEFCPSNSNTRTLTVGQREQAAVVLILNTGTFPSAAILMFRIFIANQMNTRCSRNCDACNLSPNCTDILQLCNSFSADNIKIENIDSVSNRKRAATNGTTTITFYIEAPAGTSSGATIPATVTQTIVTESSDEYEMMTGIPVAGPPEVLIPNPTQPPEDTGVDVALIVVPIVAALMVIVTVVGVILIVVIACVHKKMNVKVQPAQSTSEPRPDETTMYTEPPAASTQNSTTVVEDI